jgi:hypothetical protein
MDDIVAQALRKWPNVPHCHGWLALDARGHWWMRDDRTQAAGPFPQAKGSRIEHARLLGFIARNYGCDAGGAWYFQNGPQRVYVDLECAPWVWRVQDAPGWPLVSHTGEPAQALDTWLDEHGRLYARCAQGLGLVHSLDMALAAQAVEQGHWQPQTLAFAAFEQRFGYQRQPRPTAPAAA